MYKNLKWKVITILAVLVIFLGLGIYPVVAARYHVPIPGWLAAYQLKLGLDLKGGVQLVLRVNTDDALKLTTTATSEQLRESLRTATVPVSSIAVTSPTKFVVEGVPQDRDAQFRTSADEVAATNYDRNPMAGGR
jgi:preprotein translocase subunit SecD